jgi:hypothetical protein
MLLYQPIVGTLCLYDVFLFLASIQVSVHGNLGQVSNCSQKIVFTGGNAYASEPLLIQLLFSYIVFIASESSTMKYSKPYHYRAEESYMTGDVEDMANARDR